MGKVNKLMFFLAYVFLTTFLAIAQEANEVPKKDEKQHGREPGKPVPYGTDKPDPYGPGYGGPKEPEPYEPGKPDPYGLGYGDSKGPGPYGPGPYGPGYGGPKGPGPYGPGPYGSYGPGPYGPGGPGPYGPSPYGPGGPYGPGPYGSGPYGPIYGSWPYGPGYGYGYGFGGPGGFHLGPWLSFFMPWLGSGGLAEVEGWKREQAKGQYVVDQYPRDKVRPGSEYP